MAIHLMCRCIVFSKQDSIFTTCRLPSYGQPINFYEPKGKGSEAYMDLAIEFVKNNRPHEPKKTRARSKSAPEPAPVKNALED